MVPICSLKAADSPRQAGEDMAHIRMLAAVDAALPPILVHRSTLRVIDGMHRLRAAMLRGEEVIEARFFEGSAASAFALAAEANVTHGMPLSLVDRKAAAARIIAAQPELSDRAVAKCAGLSGKTVSAIRKRATVELPRLHARVGLDGRVRPINRDERRKLAQEAILAHPEASLREVAKIAGVSPGTVRTVRNQLQPGELRPAGRKHARERTTTNSQLTPPRGEEQGTTPEPVVRDVLTTLRVLRGDPSLKFSHSGRALLQWLHAHTVSRGTTQEVVEEIPPHCTSLVAQLARECAETWLDLAIDLERRSGA